LNPFRILSRTAWIVSAVALIAVIILGLSWCSERKRAQQARAGETLAESRSASATDASEVRDRADERTDQINDTVKGATDDVRNAESPSARNDAALRGLCRVNPGASPRCGMLVADPARNPR